MTKKQLKRRSEIIRLLCELSREGWRFATRYDYQPLEAELATLTKNEIRRNLWPVI